MAEGKSFRLGDEVRYIQRRLPTAMGASSPLVSLFLFSTETGDAWLLDPSDRRAARLAGDGDPEPVHIEENDTCFVIDWKGNDRIEGPAFIYSDRQTRRVSTILGYVLKFQISLASSSTQPLVPVRTILGTGSVISSLPGLTGIAKLAWRT